MRKETQKRTLSVTCETCGKCGGKAGSKCRQCSGKGFADVGRGRSGAQNCHKCGGSGRYTCSKCSNGTIYTAHREERKRTLEESTTVVEWHGDELNVDLVQRRMHLRVTPALDIIVEGPESPPEIGVVSPKALSMACKLTDSRMHDLPRAPAFGKPSSIVRQRHVVRHVPICELKAVYANSKGKKKTPKKENGEAEGKNPETDSNESLEESVIEEGLVGPGDLPRADERRTDGAGSPETYPASSKSSDKSSAKSSDKNKTFVFWVFGHPGARDVAHKSLPSALSCTIS